MAILQMLWCGKMVKNGGTRKYLSVSLLTSFAGGNSKETIRHLAARAIFDARMRGARVSVQIFFINKCASLRAGTGKK